MTAQRFVAKIFLTRIAYAPEEARTSCFQSCDVVR
jgi:hypothetical protein